MISAEKARRLGRISILRVPKIRRLFPGGSTLQVDARVARLCVLFEDLRIELYGLTMVPEPYDQQSDFGLDRAGYKTRQLYFLRRAIGTCREFAEAIRLLDECPGFTVLYAKFTETSKASWRDAVDYFDSTERYWRRIRNDVSGHFGEEACRFAVENLRPSAVGSIEIHGNGEDKSGAILSFASEIAATALVRRLEGDSDEEKVHGLFDEATRAFPKAIAAVYCLVAHQIWQSAE